MSSDQSGTLKTVMAIFLGILFIAAGLGGKPGSLLGALIDAEDMASIGDGGSTGEF
jgi:hypothetical protein